jgi:hypothetical protein
MKTSLKTIMKAVGGVLVLVGAIWVLQGINLLPGSFMTGDPQWTVNGAITIVIGAAVFLIGSRN